MLRNDVADRARFFVCDWFELLVCDEFEASLRAVSSPPLRSGGGVAYTDAAILNCNERKQKLKISHVCVENNTTMAPSQPIITRTSYSLSNNLIFWVKAVSSAFLFSQLAPNPLAKVVF